MKPQQSQVNPRDDDHVRSSLLQQAESMHLSVWKYKDFMQQLKSAKVKRIAQSLGGKHNKPISALSLEQFPHPTLIITDRTGKFLLF